MKLLATLAALALLAAATSTASAQDAKPTFTPGCGLFKKDSDSDAGTGDPISSETGAPEEAEIENAWATYDGAKATVNVTIKNLTGEVPPPATSITYNATYGITTGVTNFVRAYVDFTGSVAYEYGHTEPLGPSTRYAYDGPTEGQLFPGEHGVVQMVFPADAGGKPGTTLKGITAQTQVGRTTVLPGAISQSPSRGLSYQNDDLGVGSFTVAPCDGAAAPAAPPASAPAPAAAPPAQPASGPLPVTLVSKKVKRAKKGKKVALKLKSSESLSAIGVRISKGKRVFGTAKLSKLSGTKTLRVKAKRSLKKGRYLLAVAGTDAQGQRRLATFKLAVR